MYVITVEYIGLPSVDPHLNFTTNCCTPATGIVEATGGDGPEVTLNFDSSLVPAGQSPTITFTCGSAKTTIPLSASTTQIELTALLHEVRTYTGTITARPS